jgi:hypothetical protein
MRKLRVDCPHTETAYQHDVEGIAATKRPQAKRPEIVVPSFYAGHSFLWAQGLFVMDYLADIISSP